MNKHRLEKLYYLLEEKSFISIAIRNYLIAVYLLETFSSCLTGRLFYFRDTPTFILRYIKLIFKKDRRIIQEDTKDSELFEELYRVSIEELRTRTLFKKIF